MWKSVEKAKSYRSEYWIKNREKLLKANRRYRTLHIDECKERDRLYYLNVRKLNPEREKEVKKRSYLKHRDKRLKWHKRYRRKNKAKRHAEGKRYHAENRERINRQHRENYQKRREQRLAQILRYRKTHPRLMKKRQRAYRQKYHEKIAAKNKAYNKKHALRNSIQKVDYRQRNAEACRRRYKKHYRTKKWMYHAKVVLRRARKRGVAVGDPKAIRAFYKHVREAEIIICHWCGELVPRGRRHVDHKVPIVKHGPHCVTNLVAACKDCNLSKHDMMPDEFMARLAILKAKGLR